MLYFFMGPAPDSSMDKKHACVHAAEVDGFPQIWVAINNQYLKFFSSSNYHELDPVLKLRAKFGLVTTLMHEMPHVVWYARRLLEHKRAGREEAPDSARERRDKALQVASSGI